MFILIDRTYAGQAIQNRVTPFVMLRSVKWPERYGKEAAEYDGPWEEEKNINDFMTCKPSLQPCETTHAHPKSVCI
jgi:hypothetical protein